MVKTKVIDGSLIDWNLFSEPFPAEDIEWRVQQAGTNNNKIWARVLAYITNRAIMERLDEVVGPACWQNQFVPGPAGGVMCGISIKISGEWVTKWDGADNTDIESVKGGLSSSMKRTAVQWGIGRYLYNLSADYATVSTNGKHYQKRKVDKHGKVVYEAFKWDEPKLPAFALPDGTEQKPAQQAPPLRNQAKDKPPSTVQLDYETLFQDCKNMAELQTSYEVAKVKDPHNIGDIARAKDIRKGELNG